MIAVRRASAEDADQVQRLVEKMEIRDGLPEGQFLQVYLNNLSDPNMIYLVVTIDGVVVAFGSLVFGMPLHYCKPVARIQELVVDEHSRGKSVGAQLVNAMMLVARDRGCCRLEADTHRSDKSTHRFFSKHGFFMTHFKLTMNIEFKIE